MLEKKSKEESSIGTKYDSDKLQWGLFDVNIRQELKFACRMMDNVECDPEDLNTNLFSLIGYHSYILAAAMVMQIKGVREEDIVRVYSEGARKYTADNWKSVTPASRYLSAAMRHMKDGINTEDFGVSHWTHFCWNMVAMRWFEKHGTVVE